MARGDCLQRRRCTWSQGNIYSATDGPGGPSILWWIVRGGGGGGGTTCSRIALQYRMFDIAARTFLLL